MLKKVFGMVIAFALAFTCMAPAYAANVMSNDTGIAPMSVNESTATVSDSAGNKFFVRGVSYRSGDRGETRTSYETTYYKEGTVTAKNELDSNLL